MMIVPRGKWGAAKWRGRIAYVGYRKRTHFVIHYEGGNHTRDTGAAAMRNIQRTHLARGWSGVGYNFVIDQVGTVFEGRGWTRVGAHCPGHNTGGIGVQIHVGGDQEPTPAALAACVDLYHEACRRTRRDLKVAGHGDLWATECPGSVLRGWIRGGMPLGKAVAAPAVTASGTTEVDGMDLYRDPDGRIWDVGNVGRRYVIEPRVVHAYEAKGGKVGGIDHIALSTIPRLPDNGLAEWLAPSPHKDVTGA